MWNVTTFQVECALTYAIHNLYMDISFFQTLL